MGTKIMIIGASEVDPFILVFYLKFFVFFLAFDNGLLDTILPSPLSHEFHIGFHFCNSGYFFSAAHTRVA